MSLKFTILVLSALSVSACVGSPEQFRSTPVTLTTSKGPVKCQLYTRGQVAWDRSIDRPESMSLDEAEGLCASEGLRRKEGGEDTPEAVTDGGLASPWG